MDESEAPETPQRGLPGSGWVWLVIGVVFLVTGAIGGYASYTATAAQNCVKHYLSQSAPLAQERDDATQKLWNDLAAAERYTLAKDKIDAIDDMNHGVLKDKPIPLDSTPEQVGNALNHLFLADLTAEQEASQALAHYRATHVPSKACPS